MNEEVWKPVVGWEGLYEVSNTGRVRSLDRQGVNEKGHGKRNGKVLAPNYTKFGYIRVGLSINGKKTSYMVHRLVAEAFIPNPENLPFINHKDEIRNNNNAENLEWCTRLYNMRYGNCREKIRASHINNPKLSKQVVKCDLKGNPIQIYPSMAEAARKNGLSQGRISNCCLKRKKCVTHGGFKWKFYNGTT